MPIWSIVGERMLCICVCIKCALADVFTAWPCLSDIITEGLSEFAAAVGGRVSLKRIIELW